jgi:dTDP-glucose 4,6-dehydratase
MTGAIMKNVLVTGGAGFIGSNFVRMLLREKACDHLVNLDALTYAGSLENLKTLSNLDRYTFVHGDICDQMKVEKLFDQYQLDTVVHFAAESHVDRSITAPGEFIKTNVVGTFTLLEVAKQFWLTKKSVPLEHTRFHHVSTDEVYGSLREGDPAFSETTPYAPNSPYAASKAASDHLVRAYAHTYRLPTTITNCSNNYGAYQFPEKLIPLIILRATEGLPLPIYGDGKQIRDWLYVEDHCDAILDVLQNAHPGETFNIGGNNQPTNLEMIEKICEILDELKPDSPFVPHSHLIQFVADRPGHDRRYAMNTTKVRDQLGWEPQHTLEKGLRKTIEWYLANTDWLTAIRSRSDFQSWVQKNYTVRGDNK